MAATVEFEGLQAFLSSVDAGRLRPLARAVGAAIRQHPPRANQLLAGWLADWISLDEGARRAAIRWADENPMPGLRPLIASLQAPPVE
jgi:hypothetical protein